jgi:hypothetical protein
MSPLIAQPTRLKRGKLIDLPRSCISYIRKSSQLSSPRFRRFHFDPLGVGVKIRRYCASFFRIANSSRKFSSDRFGPLSRRLVAHSFQLAALFSDGLFAWSFLCSWTSRLQCLSFEKT